MTSNADAQSGGVSRPDPTARVVKAFITLGALAVLALHLLVPELGLDAPALILLGIAVIPWLDVIFESIDTPFGGVKYRAVTQRLDELTGESASLRQIQEANEARDRVQSDGFTAQVPPSDRLGALAEEYNTVREPERGMRSGAERTAVMTKIVGQMIAAADAGAAFPLDEALRGGDLGRRLAAYAVLYARPDPAYTILLVNSVIELEPKPFGQFWGLRAISRLIEFSGSQAVDLNTARRLKGFATGLPTASDRMFELRKILDQLGLR